MRDLAEFALNPTRLTAVVRTLAQHPLQCVRRVATVVGSTKEHTFVQITETGEPQWRTGGPFTIQSKSSYSKTVPRITECILNEAVPRNNGIRRVNLIWVDVSGTSVLVLFDIKSKTLASFRMSGDSSGDAAILAAKSLSKVVDASRVITETSPVPIVPHSILESAGVVDHEAGSAALPLLVALTVWGYGFGASHPGAMAASKLKDALFLQKLLFSVEKTGPVVGGAVASMPSVHDHGRTSLIDRAEEPLRALVAFADKPSVMELKLRIINALRAHKLAHAFVIAKTALLELHPGAKERGALSALVKVLGKE